MTLASLAEAWAWLDAIPYDSCESISVSAALGRVLAAPIQAPADLPDCDRAGTNGFAVRAAETEGAGPYNPLAPAGGLSLVSSGMAMPSAADAVLPLESVGEAESVDEARFVVAPIAPGEGVIRAGEQVRAGAKFLRAGRRLRALDVALLACLGIAKVAVRRMPQVELSIRGPRHGADALTPLLSGLLAQDGAVVDGGDLLLIAGRCGWGCDDDAPAAFIEAGGRIDLRGIAIRPGAMSSLGRLGTTPVLLLPGEPLACLAAYCMLASRLVRRMAGLGDSAPIAATLRRKISSGVGYADFSLVRLIGAHAEPILAGGLAGAADADGYVIVPETSEGFAQGSEVDVHRLEPGWI
jgi:molybdopterin molybdotransferase